MMLKKYQQDVLRKVKGYLETLYQFRSEWERGRLVDPAFSLNFPQQAWAIYGGTPYHSKRNGIGEELPHFCLQVPTGGGKTLLAVHTIDLINRYYLKKRTGFILWIVPTNQIYRQTLSALRDREHPYRQTLDMASGGRTLIIEKLDRFTPQDVNNSLVIMLLMLPSANRRNKETLKIFQDAGGFELFFPPEDQPGAHEHLLKQVPNLDCYGTEHELFGKQVKTSLANTLKLLKPVIIIDEGQKAYSPGAQETIRQFNPQLVVELSATPPRGSNILVSVKGKDLLREEMIKLDLHIINKQSTDWRDTLRATVKKRQLLEKKALQYEKRTGKYIRPIALIQVERTGKDQRGQGYIHAEDARDYLLTECGIPPHEVAIKTSAQDDIEEIHLLSRSSPIRYIITKSALQEGWDCPFAYCLAILTRPTAQTALTQLVGRILRQPYARKTNIPELDESYVFCFRREAQQILKEIKAGLEGEGLADLAEQIVLERDEVGEHHGEKKRNREKDGTSNRFNESAGHADPSSQIARSLFVIYDRGRWREVIYEMDLVSRINWVEVKLDQLAHLSLNVGPPEEMVIDVGYEANNKDFKLIPFESQREAGEIDHLFITRQLLKVVPNPWVAYELAQHCITILRQKYEDGLIANQLVYIVEELIKTIEAEKDRLCEAVFGQLLQADRLRLVQRNGDGANQGHREQANHRPRSTSVPDEYNMLLRWYHQIQSI